MGKNTFIKLQSIITKHWLVNVNCTSEYLQHNATKNYSHIYPNALFLYATRMELNVIRQQINSTWFELGFWQYESGIWTENILSGREPLIEETTLQASTFFPVDSNSGSSL